MSEPPHQQRVHRVIDRDRSEADEHRRACVIQGIERRRKYLDSGVTGKPDGVGGKRVASLGCVESRESAMLEYQGNDGPAENDQPNGRGNAPEKNQR